MNLMPSITMIGLVVVFRGIMNTSGSSGSYVILSVCSMALGVVTTILGFLSGNKNIKRIMRNVLQNTTAILTRRNTKSK